MTRTVSSIVVQETHYDPWGLALTGLGFQASGIKANKYLYNGKEQIQDHALRYYDYGARMLCHVPRAKRFGNPVIGRWGVVDPLAEQATGWTPYRAFFNNPLRYIDPDGLFEHDYGLDKNGNIALIRQTADSKDRIIALDSDKIETGNSIIIDKGIINSKKTETRTGTDGNKYSIDQFTLTGDDQSKSVFEFVAENSGVEWGLTGIGQNIGQEGKNLLSTTHMEKAEAGGGLAIVQKHTIRYHLHSHPNNSTPSPGDLGFAKHLNSKFPSANLYIYYKNNYYPYNENGPLLEK